MTIAGCLVFATAASAQTILGEKVVAVGGTVTLTVVGPPPPHSFAVSGWTITSGDDKVELSSTTATSAVVRGLALSEAENDVEITAHGTVTQVAPDGTRITYPFAATHALTVLGFEITGPRYVELGGRVGLAVAEAPGATYSWSSGSPLIAISPDKNHLTVDGLRVSKQEGDVTVGVTVTVGESTFTDTHVLTVVELQLLQPTTDQPVLYRGNAKKDSRLIIAARARVRPADLEPKLKWSVTPVADSHDGHEVVHLVWDSPWGGDPLLGAGPSPTATFTGLPPRNADFGKKPITVEIDGLGLVKRAVPKIFYRPSQKELLADGRRVALWYYYFSADGRGDDQGVCSFTRTPGTPTFAEYGGGKDNLGGEYIHARDAVLLYDGALELDPVEYDSDWVSLDYPFKWGADGVEHSFWHETWHKWIAAHLKVAATVVDQRAKVGAGRLTVRNTVYFRPSGTLFAGTRTIAYTAKTPTAFVLAAPLAAEVPKDILLTDRQDDAGASFDWDTTAAEANRDVDQPQRDGAENPVDPDNDEDWLPDQFEELLNAELGSALFGIDDHTSAAFAGFPFSFTDASDGDQAVYLEWRLSLGHVPDFADGRNWRGVAAESSPNLAPRIENDWSENGANW